MKDKDMKTKKKQEIQTFVQKKAFNDFLVQEAMERMDKIKRRADWAIKEEHRKLVLTLSSTTGMSKAEVEELLEMMSENFTSQ